MTPEEAIERVRKAQHIVIRHRGSCFFNTTDYDEALKWEGMGATIVPHYTLDEIEHRKKKGRHTKPGWEVHLLGVLAPIEEEDANGDLVNITADALLDAARRLGATR